jgi:4-amino-4-deoxy-L-arabinose transferase-like glycosyltransferase
LPKVSNRRRDPAGSKPLAKTSKARVVVEPKQEKQPTSILSFPASWPAAAPYVILALATILCLLPFSGRAFHVDDTLFLRTAQNIVKHPLDPYGFQITWDWAPQQMSEITQNPPLASYYAALVGILLGWSERALHLAFLLITVLLILGTYRLAAKFTRIPLLAALATLLAPGVLVSASSVMCDTMMLTLWVWAAIFWIEGLERHKHLLLALAALLAGASALTKYFGVALLPLLFVYSLLSVKRIGAWVLHFLIPIAILLAYQLWTEDLYGHGLLLGAAQFASEQRAHASASWPAMAITGLSFAGGCTLSTLVFAALLWSRKMLAWTALGSVAATLLIASGALNLGLQVGGNYAQRQNWLLVDTQLTLWIAGGIFLLALAIADYGERKDAHSALLGLWVLGTFIFAAFLNYTVNARSVLPLIPAAGILIARRIETIGSAVNHLRAKVAVGLLMCGAIALLVAAADAGLGNSARQAASMIAEKTRGRAGTLWFEGHWGFQYYMEQAGALPLNLREREFKPGDFVALPSNNIQTRGINPQLIASSQQIEIQPGGFAGTIDGKHRAGFYSAYWGPLPFVIVRPPVERYQILRIGNGVTTK